MTAAVDFQPLERAPRAELPSQPAPSLWQAAWRRLKRNPRALMGGWAIILMAAFTVLGPWVWQVDPGAQAPARASLGPQAGYWAQVVTDEAWQPAPLQAPEPLTLVVDEANTARVRLRWTALPAAEGYRLFRHERMPRSATDLGLPLAELSPAETAYEDKLRLRARDYVYTLQAMLPEGGERQVRVQVRPGHAITSYEAKLQGLLAIGEPVAVEQLYLPAHPLGTDHLGRDMLARLMEGARTSLFIGLLAPLLFVGLGSVYGALAALLGGAWDDWMMRFADFIVALPFLLFVILIRIAFGIGPGESGILALVVAMVMLGWPTSARLVRAQVLQLREQGFVEAARLSGAGYGYLVVRHLLPNVSAIILVALSFAVPQAIFTEAFLSFIGMGVTPPTASWGAMANDGMQTLFNHPQQLLLPSLLISITVLAFNALGDALRDELDVRAGERL
ncbi:MAG TPA: ABC transporter permease [Spongiibacteraceae bacterium]|jgi:oligopeptide transport system permease protein|nr:ABC transporter permease [Spongiibacteraceae bacterium]HUH38557.1 ABC transporter permease [Spongiibacteraceae bacterium]